MKFRLPINVSVKCVACTKKLDAIIVDDAHFDLVIAVDNEHKCPAAEHVNAADGANPSVEQVICPICQNIVNLYDGNKVGMHTPHCNASEPICKMSGVEITPHR